MELKKSTRKDTKYMVLVSDKWIHFGDKNYQHYEDKTPLGLYSHLDHHDVERRNRYLKRATKIRDKQGNFTCDDTHSSNFFAIKYLW